MTVGQVNNCNLCNAVDGVYFPDPNAQHRPSQIDNGKLTDDTAQADADAPDPLARRSDRGLRYSEPYQRGGGAHHR
jgi:hypothetical protein